MLTVLEAIQKSTQYLQEKGIESPRANAEILLADILHCKRLNLYLMFDKPMNEDEISNYRVFLKRRAQFEPLQYITGNVEFYGIDFKVNPSVLIPRPETELLVEAVINSVDKNKRITILDIGSGSGNISITLAANLSNASITGIDITEDSIELALENLSKHSFKDRVRFIKGDILNYNFSSRDKFDIVVSNPPYVSANEFENVQKEIKEYEPKIAVTDFSDGYKFYHAVTVVASKILKNKGKLFFELGQGQSAKVKEIMNENNFSEISIINDYQNIERVIYGTKK